MKLKKYKKAEKIKNFFLAKLFSLAFKKALTKKGKTPNKALKIPICIVVKPKSYLESNGTIVNSMLLLALRAKVIDIIIKTINIRLKFFFIQSILSENKIFANTRNNNIKRQLIFVVV